jgi:hypothetical protein
MRARLETKIARINIHNIYRTPRNQQESSQVVQEKSGQRAKPGIFQNEYQ